MEVVPDQKHKPAYIAEIRMGGNLYPPNTNWSTFDISLMTIHAKYAAFKSSIHEPHPKVSYAPRTLTVDQFKGLHKRDRTTLLRSFAVNMNSRLTEVNLKDFGKGQLLLLRRLTNAVCVAEKDIFPEDIRKLH